MDIFDGSLNEQLSRRSWLQKSAAGLAGAAIASSLGPSSILAAGRSQPIQIALVGGQHIHTPDFAERMASSDLVETRYVWDSSPDTARSRSDVTGGEVIDDPQFIYDDPEVEAVVITSRTARHRELVLPAVEAGKHVFVEKPLGMDGEEARELADAINEAGVIFQTGFFMRSDPNHILVREVIQNGDLGTVTRLRLSNAHSGAIGDWFGDEWRWMADRQYAGVGGFGDLGAHVVDLLVWFMEDHEVQRATGHIDTAIERYEGTDEFGEGMVTFDTGTVATIAAGWVDVANPNTLEVNGTEGHVRITEGDLFLRSDHIEGADASEPWTDLPEEEEHPLEQFFLAIAGEEQPLVSPDEAALGNKIITAIYEGSEAKEWVGV